MILVTGGAGYVGSHFVKTYLERHPDVSLVVVDNLSEGHRKALDFSDRIHFFQEDIGDADAMGRLFKWFPIEAVVHFAANAYVGESQVNPGKYFHNNVANSISLFRAMDDAGVKRLVFSSTCATYGVPQQVPIYESHPQNPINVYGLTKLMMEMTMRAYAETRGWSFVALRYFNAAGADPGGTIGEHHEPETHLIPLVLQAIEVYGTDYDTPDGTCIRDYIHVNDLATAHIQALNLMVGEKQVAEAINLGTTHGASVTEVIDVCRKVTGQDIPVQHGPRRPGDPPVLVANADKAKARLGWQPKSDLRHIIETAWQWEQNRRF
jgi:UDP-glucose 4-epimerase